MLKKENNLLLTQDVITSSVEDTYAFAGTCIPLLKEHRIICLEGALGSGKTTFVQGLVKHLHPSSHIPVQSPTFVYLNIYNAISPPIYHFDLYRLSNEAAFMSMDFDEYFFSDGLCCIEWPERIQNIIPSSALYITIEHLDPTKRKFHIHTHK